ELKSDRIKLGKNSIADFHQSAILINGTKSHDQDLGYTLIRDSSHVGIEVSERVERFMLRNAIFINISGIGVNIEGSLSKVGIENVEFVNCSSHSMSVKSQALEVEEITLTKVIVIGQGHGGSIHVEANFTRCLTVSHCYLNIGRNTGIVLKQSCLNNGRSMLTQNSTVIFTNNTLMQNDGVLLDLAVPDGATINISNNYVSKNNPSNASALFVLHGCDATESSWLSYSNSSLIIEGNLFTKNEANYAISIIGANQDVFVVVTRNMFLRNKNDGAVIFVQASEAVQLFCNYFEDNFTPYGIITDFTSMKGTVDWRDNCWITKNDTNLFISTTAVKHGASVEPAVQANVEIDKQTLSSFTSRCEESCDSPR
ncbi:unnamed protein product, partial [Soboliphyme baturini]|uniref:Beta_helix domain-containing protein n=1 Tax=Soboliphyme baturini TaxID=241478 RepID=A0A183IAH9_9BILA